MNAIKKHRTLSAFIWGIVLLYILWVFSNSMATGTDSSHLSERVARYLLQYVNHAGFSIDFNRWHFYVRKLAHFSEYALAGFLTVLAIHIQPLCRPWLNYILFWTVPPFMDEGIQLFTNGRSASFRDCLIDMSGFFSGSLLMYILLLIIADIAVHLHSAGTKRIF